MAKNENKKADKKADKKEKAKMVRMIPNTPFGFERRAYRAGEEYVMAKKDLPAVRKGTYEVKPLKSAKKAKAEAKASKKAEAKKVPVVGKK